MPYFPNNIVPVTNFNPFVGSNLDWIFSLPQTDLVYFTPATSQTLANRTLTITLPNFDALLGNDIYSEYRIFAENTTPSVPTEISISTQIAAAGTLITSNNLSFVEIISFANLETATPVATQIRRERRYIVKGKRVDNDVFEEIRSYERNFVVQFVTTGFVYISPSIYNFTRVLGVDAAPSISVTIFTVSTTFIMVHPDVLATGAALVSPITFASGYVGYTLTETTTITLTLADSANNQVDVFREDLLLLGASLSSSGNPNQLNAALRGNIFVASTAEFFLTPQSMNFLMVLGQDAPVSQNLQIYGPGNWSLVAPTWLQVGNTSGNSVGNVVVSPVDSQFFSEGVYQNNIVVTASGITYIVPVTITVVNQFQLNLNNNGINFTRNNLAFTYIYNASLLPMYVVAELEIPQIGYPFAEELPTKYNYRLGFFKQKAAIHIGEIVDRALIDINANHIYDLLQSYVNNQTITDELINYYKPTLLTIKLSIFKQEDDILFAEKSFPLIRFVKGRDKGYSQRLLVFDKSNAPKKVTQKSVRLLNFLTSQTTLIEVYVNGQGVTLFNAITQERIYGKMLDFSSYQVGDVIEYRVHPIASQGNPARSQSIKFIVFPQDKHHSQIIYEDEHGLPNLFDFGGDWQFATENQLITSISYKNLVEALKNEKSIKSRSLTINTGYIPATDQCIVEQILDSKNCWLIGNQTEKLIELVPNQFEMVNYNSDLDLYQYQVSFTINPTHDLQNYS